MKRLERGDDGPDIVRFIAARAQKAGLSEYPADVVAKWGGDIASQMQNLPDHRLRGMRAEALFGALAAGLGSAALIKAEDGGEVYHDTSELAVPDYLVVLKDGRRLSIEVKTAQLANGGASAFKLSQARMDAYHSYCQLVGTELYFAVLWGEGFQWTLVPAHKFATGEHGRKKAQLGHHDAIIYNEFAILGDRLISTPPPLRFRLLFKKGLRITDSTKQHLWEDGIRESQLLSGDQVLPLSAAKVAWQLLLNGNWKMHRSATIMKRDRIVGMDALFAPPDWIEQPEYQFTPPDQDGLDTLPHLPIIASLSDLFTTQYLRMAASTVLPPGSPTILEPGVLGKNLIPQDWLDPAFKLHLIQLHQVQR